MRADVCVPGVSHGAVSMVVNETETRLPETDGLRPLTDRVTREPAEHPDRIPPQYAAHPVTRSRRTAPARERIG